MLEEQNKFQTIFSADQIKTRVQELGQQLSEKLASEDQITAVCTLKGSFLFYSDLIRHINKDIQCDFLSVSGSDDSEGTSPHHHNPLTLDLSNPIKNRCVLLVTDIVVTGNTIAYLQKLLQLRQPKSLTTIALLVKSGLFKAQCPIDYIGFEIKNQCVVGYGLQYKNYFMNLPYIAQVQGFN